MASGRLVSPPGGKMRLSLSRSIKCSVAYINFLLTQLLINNNIFRMQLGILHILEGCILIIFNCNFS